MGPRIRLLLMLGGVLAAAIVAVAWVAPASRRVDEAASTLFATAQSAMTQAHKLDSALLLTGSEKATALASLRIGSTNAALTGAVESLERCLAEACAANDFLAMKVKGALAKQVAQSRLRLRVSQSSRHRSELVLLGVLALGATGALVAFLWPSSVAPRTQDAPQVDVDALEQTLRDRLEQLYEVRKRSRENARFAAFGEVAAGLSHGLKTPLACVRAATQVAQAKICEDHAAQKNLDDVIDEVDGLVDQINRFLKTMGSGDPELEVLDPIQLFAPIDERYRSGPADAKVSWGMDISETVHGIYAASELIEMALRNLIDNAFEASGSGAQVRLIVRHCAAPARVGIDAERPTEGLLRRDWVEIAVLDQGPGIAPTIASKEHVVSTRAGGSGLGIAIARRIAARLGGTLELVPREDEQGTRASFILPPVPKTSSTVG